MNGDVLEKYYWEELKERLISHLAAVKGITLEDAMGGYYRNRLAEKIYEGLGTVQYLDYRVLVRILLSTEPELFTAQRGIAW